MPPSRVNLPDNISRIERCTSHVTYAASTGLYAKMALSVILNNSAQFRPKVNLEASNELCNSE